MKKLKAVKLYLVVITIFAAGAIFMMSANKAYAEAFQVDPSNFNVVFEDAGGNVHNVLGYRVTFTSQLACNARKFGWKAIYTKNADGSATHGYYYLPGPAPDTDGGKTRAEICASGTPGQEGRWVNDIPKLICSNNPFEVKLEVLAGNNLPAGYTYRGFTFYYVDSTSTGNTQVIMASDADKNYRETTSGIVNMEGGLFYAEFAAPAPIATAVVKARIQGGSDISVGITSPNAGFGGTTRYTVRSSLFKRADLIAPITYGTNTFQNWIVEPGSGVIALNKGGGTVQILLGGAGSTTTYVAVYSGSASSGSSSYDVSCNLTVSPKAGTIGLPVQFTLSSSGTGKWIDEHWEFDHWDSESYWSPCCTRDRVTRRCRGCTRSRNVAKYAWHLKPAHNFMYKLYEWKLDYSDSDLSQPDMDWRPASEYTTKVDYTYAKAGKFEPKLYVRLIPDQFAPGLTYTDNEWNGILGPSSDRDSALYIRSGNPIKGMTVETSCDLSNGPIEAFMASEGQQNEISD
ncbi:MAG: hypothetical protein UT66_C0008G0009 [candidate division CPR2 bacterium GW2011_GWC1_39_9]|uniref:Uncharacterized protein n=1 Tax=candidate division CPR2 bacterium GW2011_GWC2_39_10 TaxID=1618345 RepID=A0A0G0LVW1_UNCC2|nr:MAG: hypothetical protein UT18_C0003G0026 [candidate division CPR2 bacterium GW2011_GWC2_39_10]KKR35667.1 MAG: hypothetical protein UT66_C0008G0009 [candidate division CPR2 bacterium GW2011_GWC1_39_9]